MNEARLRLLAKGYALASNYDKIPEFKDMDEDEVSSLFPDDELETLYALQEDFSGAGTDTIISAIVDEIERE